MIVRAHFDANTKYSVNTLFILIRWILEPQWNPGILGAVTLCVTPECISRDPNILCVGSYNNDAGLFGRGMRRRLNSPLALCQVHR